VRELPVASPVVTIIAVIERAAALLGFGAPGEQAGIRPGLADMCCTARALEDMIVVEL